MSDSASPIGEFLFDYASSQSGHVSEIPTHIPQKRAFKDAGADNREGPASDLFYGGLYARPRGRSWSRI